MREAGVYICAISTVCEVGERERGEDAPRPNHSMTSVGKRPKRPPYARPRSALAFQRCSMSTME